MTICSTVVSTLTNFTLVWDFVRTPNFAKAGKSVLIRLHLLAIRVLILVQAVASHSDNDLSSSLQ
jgi:potassium channel subfamily K, other eukaryote